MDFKAFKLILIYNFLIIYQNLTYTRKLYIIVLYIKIIYIK